MTPEGYKQNAAGHLVPLESVKPLDLLRDETVIKIVGKALELQKRIAESKLEIMLDIQAFLDVSAQEYGTAWGGRKGNVTLSSYDGLLQALIDINEGMVFTEQLQVAKELIDSCVIRWSKGANSHIRALVQHAFQVDKQGKINNGRVLGLLRVDIDDPEWKAAMKAIKDAVIYTGSKQYVRFRERQGPGGAWRQINLDFSSL